VVEGQFQLDNSSDIETKYYTVWVNFADGNSTFEGENSGLGVLSNTIYNLYITITKVGSDKPGEPQTDAPCKVFVEIEDWAIVEQNVTF
jgi:hypothetical protein